MMAYKSEIEWTDATWNPVTGCTKVSRGCDNCYAERQPNVFVEHPAIHMNTGLIFGFGQNA